MNRVVFLTYRMSMGYGVDLVINELAKRLKFKYDIYIICIRNESVYIDNKILTTDGTFADLQRIIKIIKPKIIVAHTSPFFELLSEIQGDFIKIAYEHGDPTPNFFLKDGIEREQIKRNKKNNVYPKMDAVIAISNFIAHDIEWKNSFIIYNGSDHILPLYNNLKVFDITKPKLKIGTLMRLGEGESNYKGDDLCRRLFLRLSNSGIEVELHLMGRGTEKDAEKFADSNVSVHLNANEDEKWSYLRELDIFISFSLWEGFNLPLVEAMSCGTVAWAFDTGAHPEVTPFLAPSIDALYSIIVKYYWNRQLIEEHSRIAYNFVRNKFKWESSASKLDSLFSSLLVQETRNIEFDKKALTDALKRRKIEARVIDGRCPGTYRVKYALMDNPLVSIIIPFKDKSDFLEKCIDSVLLKSTYNNFEIIGISNNSVEKKTFNCIEKFKKRDIRIRFYEINIPFNYSKINNLAVQDYAKGEHIILLNNDIEIITPEWIESMLEFSQRKDVGAVGCNLYYPDDTIQHAGVIIGIHEFAGHSHKLQRKDSFGYHARNHLIQNISAVTAACLMIKKSLYTEIGGLDAENLKIAFNDVDFCLRLREKGYLNVFTPFAEAYHHESVSRGNDDTFEDKERLKKEGLYCKKRHSKILKSGDPYYNPNLTLNREDFSLK